jgi:DNA-binding LytR/AlgR family response regulator
MIKVAIIEDEEETQQNLSESLTRYFSENKEEFSIDIFGDALKVINSYKPIYSVIFMDINLPYMNGMDAAEQIRKVDSQVMIIFITSLAQYAVKGYKVNAFDFIVKPFNYYTLSMTLNRALPLLEIKGKSISIKTSQSTLKVVYLNDLLYIEVANHTLYFHTLSKITSSTDTLEHFKDELMGSNFVLCNRCYLVNLKFVNGIDHNEVLVGKDRLLISRTRKKEFTASLNLYLNTGGEK